MKIFLHIAFIMLILLGIDSIISILVKNNAEKCCNKQELKSAYVWFWPFRAKWCKNCNAVYEEVGPILSLIWRYFIWPFWDGRVKVK